MFLKEKLVAINQYNLTILTIPVVKIRKNYFYILQM